jgi:hypothetical protein
MDVRRRSWEDATKTKGVVAPGEAVRIGTASVTLLAVPEGEFSITATTPPREFLSCLRASA